MGRGVSGISSNSNALQPIAINPDWAYQPDENTDLNDVVKNPIPFVGDGEDWRIGNLLENETIQTSYDGNADIDVDKIQIFKMSLWEAWVDDWIYDYCINNNVVSLGFSDIDFSELSKGAWPK